MARWLQTSKEGPMDQMTKTELRAEVLRLTTIWMKMLPKQVACLDCGVIQDVDRPGHLPACRCSREGD
jgi:hypothetical protein